MFTISPPRGYKPDIRSSSEMLRLRQVQGGHPFGWGMWWVSSYRIPGAARQWGKTRSVDRSDDVVLDRYDRDVITVRLI